MDATTQAAKKPVSKLAVAGLVLSIVGLCLPPLWLIGIGLSVAAIIATGPRKPRSGQGLAIAGVGIGALGVFTTGVIAAIAIPNFIKFQARSKQSECKSNLRAAFAAEQAYFLEHAAYTDDFARLELDLPRGNRYAYFAAASGSVEDRSRPVAQRAGRRVGIAVDRLRFPDADRRLDGPVQVPGVGLRGTCPDCAVTLGCAGQLDSDPTLDVWTISTEDRKGADGSVIPAGVVRHDVDDLTE
jgi:type IV pilus assembly protein PilA